MTKESSAYCKSQSAGVVYTQPYVDCSCLLTENKAMTVVGYSLQNAVNELPPHISFLTFLGTLAGGCCRRFLVTEKEVDWALGLGEDTPAPVVE